MVAYSFNRMFVDSIRAGLGLVPNATTFARPKRQTIRAIGNRRHARPGETMQLYSGMRTKQCFKIGDARCVGVDQITIVFGRHRDVVDVKGLSPPIPRQTSDIENLDRFAAMDGFASWDTLLKFWDEHHDRIASKYGRFDGFLIRWESIGNGELE